MATLLLIYLDAPARQAFPLPLHEVIVGRDRGCGIRIKSDSVSRRHARIYFNGDDWVIEDLQSTNGCRVNEVQVSQSVLRNADFVYLGSVKFMFSAAGASEIPRGIDQGGGGNGAPAVLAIPKPRSRN